MRATVGCIGWEGLPDKDLFFLVSRLLMGKCLIDKTLSSKSHLIGRLYAMDDSDCQPLEPDKDCLRRYVLYVTDSISCISCMTGNESQ